MITERKKKMAIITQWALEGNFCSPESALWLLAEIERLEKALEVMQHSESPFTEEDGWMPTTP